MKQINDEYRTLNRSSKNVIIYRATWMNGRTTLSNHGRFHIEIDNDKKVAKLVIDNCKASDSGLYELNISNDCGDLKVEIPVTITGDEDLLVTDWLKFLQSCF